MSHLWKVYLAVLLVTTAEGGTNTILPPYLDQAHYGLELIGFVTALFAFLQLASRLPAGAFYTAARARQLLSAFTGLFVISTSGFGLDASAPWVLTLTVLHGFAFGAITTIMLPIAIQVHAHRESHGARMGWYTAALSAGYALGSFLSGYLADRFGFPPAFVIIGLLPLGTIALALRLPDMVGVGAHGPLPQPRGGGLKRLMVAFPLLSPTLLFATLVAFYINFLDDGFGTFFPLFGLGIGLSMASIGLLKGLKSATGVGVRVLAGGIFRFVDYRLLNHALVIGWSLVVFVLPWVRETWTFVALFIFMGLARSLSRVTSATLVAEETSTDASGIGMASGVYNMGLDVGALTGPLAAGLLARATDIATMMHIIPLVMVALYFGALVWMGRASKAAPVLAPEMDREA